MLRRTFILYIFQSDIEFLYIDLFLITIFASCFGITEPFEGEIYEHMKEYVQIIDFIFILL